MRTTYQHGSCSKKDVSKAVAYPTGDRGFESLQRRVCEPPVPQLAPGDHVRRHLPAIAGPPRSGGHFGIARCEITAGDMAGSIDRLTVGPRDPRGCCPFHRIAGVARRPCGVDLPARRVAGHCPVTRLPRRSTWSTLHCASAGTGLVASMQAIRVIGALNSDLPMPLCLGFG